VATSWARAADFTIVAFRKSIVGHASRKGEQVKRMTLKTYFVFRFTFFTFSLFSAPAQQLLSEKQYCENDGLCL